MTIPYTPHKNSFPGQPMHNPLPRFESEVEHYIAMHGGRPDDIELDFLVECYEKGMQVEEAGKKIMQLQQEEGVEDAE